MCLKPDLHHQHVERRSRLLRSGCDVHKRTKLLMRIKSEINSWWYRSCPLWCGEKEQMSSPHSQQIMSHASDYRLLFHSWWETIFWTSSLVYLFVFLLNWKKNLFGWGFNERCDPPLPPPSPSCNKLNKVFKLRFYLDSSCSWLFPLSLSVICLTRRWNQWAPCSCNTLIIISDSAHYLTNPLLSRSLTKL